MSRYLDPTNDVAFKKLFSNKERLINLLNSILKLTDGNKIIDLEYIPIEQMPLFEKGKRSIFDLKVRDEAGRWYIVEMQRKVEKDYIDRVQFYGSYTYVSQIEKGIKHKELLAVVIISIIGTKVFDDDLPCINYHCFKETSTNKQYLYSLTYVFVELGKFDKRKIETGADAWLHLLKCAREENEPPKEINSSIILSAYTDLEQYRWTKEEHDAYIRSQLAVEQEESKIDISYKKGKAEGKEEGKHVEKVEIIKNLLAQGVDNKTISVATGLTIEEIKNLSKLD